MEKYGRSAVSEFLGDNIIYRNLVPIDQDIPGLADLREAAGLRSNCVPRKTTPEYAGVVASMLRHVSNQRSQIADQKSGFYRGYTPE